MAPLVPRIVRMKNCSKPLVWACVTTKKPTPKMMPARLISIERLRAVRNRRAMRRFVDTAVGPGALLGQHAGAHAVALAEPVDLLGHDQFAFLHALENLDLVHRFVAFL